MNVIDEIKKYQRENTGLVHASNILAKNSSRMTTEQKKGFERITEKYYEYLKSNLDLKGNSYDDVKVRSAKLNSYYNFFHDNGYDNLFSSQGKFRSTILEEFMYLLFKDLVDEINKKHPSKKLYCGSSKAYANLFFTARNLNDFIESPTIGINQKDQDFAIYRNLSVTVENKTFEVKMPIVAIECKTYIDKTMLEGSIATAEKIKSGNPYALFFIVTENYDVSLDVDPAYSRIDQVFVLRKCTRKSMDANWKNVSADVLWPLVAQVKDYFKREWSDVSNRLTSKGMIISHLWRDGSL